MIKKIIGLLFICLVFFSNTFFKELNLSNQQKNQKCIYLTFDDGPLNGSQRINKVVYDEKIPITVLLVGEHGLVRPKDVALYKENPYIQVGNHSYSHANNHYKLYYSNPTGVLKDFIKNMDTLKLDNKIARLPGRNMWRINERSRNDVDSGTQAADLLSKNGFSLFGWDIEWSHDPHTAEPIGTANEIYKQIEQKLNDNKLFTKSHIVLLCHDEMFQTSYEESELKKLMDILKSNKDYKFAHLKDYP